MTAGEVAGLIAAGAFAVLVLLAAVPLLKLGRLLDEARFTLHDLGKDVEPILTETASTISRANREIDKIDGVTTTLAHMTENVANVLSSVSSVVSSPFARIAGLLGSWGLARRGKKSTSRTGKGKNI